MDSFTFHPWSGKALRGPQRFSKTPDKSHFEFFVVFKAVIPPERAKSYLAGAFLLGAAPCTAMVFVWSPLTKGNPAYTVSVRRTPSTRKNFGMV